ncbi:MAG: hypothetical protein ABI672_19210, partial [Vicinamibacteria bacterium]
ATEALIEADWSCESLAEPHRTALRRVISGLVGVAHAIGESHNEVTRRLDALEASGQRKSFRPIPLAAGME